MYIKRDLLANTAAFCAAIAIEGGSGSPSAAPAIRNRAVTFAKVVNGDDAFGLIITEALDAGETVKRSPLTVMVRLQKDYGKELDEWPVPNSKEGNNPDNYKEKVWSLAKKTMIDKPGSFYKDWCGATEEGASILEQIEALEIADSTPDKGEKDLVDMGSLAIQQAIQMMKQRFTAYVALVRQAVSTHLKLNELRAEFGDVVRVDYSKEKDKVTPKKATLPLFVQDLEDATKAKAFGVKAFCNLNVAKAKAKGGDYGAIISSGGSQGGQGQGALADDEGFMVEQTNWEDTVSAEAHFVDDVDNIQFIYKSLKAKDAEGNHVSDDLLLSMRKIAREYTSIITKPEQAARLKALDEKEAKAA